MLLPVDTASQNIGAEIRFEASGFFDEETCFLRPSLNERNEMNECLLKGRSMRTLRAHEGVRDKGAPNQTGLARD